MSPNPVSFPVGERGFVAASPVPVWGGECVCVPASAGLGKGGFAFACPVSAPVLVSV